MGRIKDFACGFDVQEKINFLYSIAHGKINLSLMDCVLVVFQFFTYFARGVKIGIYIRILSGQIGLK